MNKLVNLLFNVCIPGPGPQGSGDFQEDDMGKRGGKSSVVTRDRKEAAKPDKTPKEQARQKFEKKKKKRPQEGR